MGKIITGLIIVLILAVVIFGAYQFFKPEVFSGKVVQEKEDLKCQSDYIFEVIDSQYLDNHINHNCPSINGGVREGKFEATIKITNPNDILLSIPCSLIISKTNFDTNPPTIYGEKVLENWVFDIGSGSTEIITKNFEIPECYDTWNVECKDIGELPECN